VSSPGAFVIGAYSYTELRPRAKNLKSNTSKTSCQCTFKMDGLDVQEQIQVLDHVGEISGKTWESNAR